MSGSLVVRLKFDQNLTPAPAASSSQTAAAADPAETSDQTDTGKPKRKSPTKSDPEDHPSTRQEWSAEEDAAVRAHMNDKKGKAWKDVSKQIGRTPQALRIRAHNLKWDIKKATKKAKGKGEANAIPKGISSRKVGRRAAKTRSISALTISSSNDPGISHHQSTPKSANSTTAINGHQHQYHKDFLYFYTTDGDQERTISSHSASAAADHTPQTTPWNVVANNTPERIMSGTLTDSEEVLNAADTLLNMVTGGTAGSNGPSTPEDACCEPKPTRGHARAWEL